MLRLLNHFRNRQLSAYHRLENAPDSSAVNVEGPLSGNKKKNKQVKSEYELQDELLADISQLQAQIEKILIPRKYELSRLCLIVNKYWLDWQFYSSTPEKGFAFAEINFYKDNSTKIFATLPQFLAYLKQLLNAADNDKINDTLKALATLRLLEGFLSTLSTHLIFAFRSLALASIRNYDVVDVNTPSLHEVCAPILTEVKNSLHSCVARLAAVNADALGMKKELSIHQTSEQGIFKESDQRKIKKIKSSPHSNTNVLGR